VANWNARGWLRLRTRATNGVVFDTEEARLFQPEEAVQLVRKIEANRAVRARIDEAVKRKLFPDTDV